MGLFDLLLSSMKAMKIMQSDIHLRNSCALGPWGPSRRPLGSTDGLPWDPRGALWAEGPFGPWAGGTLGPWDLRPKLRIMHDRRWKPF